jgi:hypothetical protein
MPYGMESNSSAIPAGIPFSSTKRSNEIGSRLTGCLGGVLTRHAATKPIVPDMSEQAKIVSKEYMSCMKRPIIGPKLMAVLFISP